MIAVDWSRRETASARSAAELIDRRASAFAIIKAAAGAARAKYISTIPGQEMIYLAKEREAVAYLAGEPGDYPFLAAEVGETGETIEQVAQVILNLAAAWRVIGAGIEALRVRANAAVHAAEDVEAVDAALAVFTEGIAAW